ncbi:trehalose-phosphatase [Sphingomonas sp.]|uniref:trehalose-phosphatase n=1 Tax=Sphingomonas sp. TaxID=28214 RepID=UPI00182687A3|nr:trehalose-phosphatase [Sphingomonas sp.]MBA3511333.1 trehalose-phosphatase [Sphingomonas sp.]
MNRIPDSVSAPPTELLRGASLFLDFDGTLVDITATPDAVVVTEQLRRLLVTLQERLGERVAIITGRSASNVEGLFKPVPVLVGGSHGLEIPGDRGDDRIHRPAALDEIIAELREVERTYPGVLVEVKPLGVALHYRQAPDAEQACRTATEQAAARSGLEVQAGKMVFELKPRGADKGAAVRTLMSRPPFAGSRPVFLGDDLTDEPAFAAARELGGAGVLIGDPRPTAAAYRLPTVAAALEWLAEASGAAR